MPQGSVACLPALSWLPLPIFMISSVSGRCAALISLRCCKGLPRDKFFTLHVVILLNTVSLSNPPLFFSGEGISGSSRLNFQSLAQTFCIFFAIPFLQSGIQGILAQSTSVEGRALLWTEVTLHFQQKSRLTHVSFGLSPLRCFFCIVVEKIHSSDVHRHNRVRNYFRSLHHSFRKWRKGREVLFFLLQVANVTIVKQGRGVSNKRSCVERGRSVVVFEERIRNLNHEKDVLPRKCEEGWFIMV